MKNVISYILLGLLILAIPLVVLFVQNQRQTQLRSQAAAADGEVKFVEQPGVLQCTGTSCTTTVPVVDVEIKAPVFNP